MPDMPGCLLHCRAVLLQSAQSCLCCYLNSAWAILMQGQWLSSEALLINRIWTDWAMAGGACRGPHCDVFCHHLKRLK